MRLTKLTIVACAVLLLATAPIAAAQAGQPGQIAPDRDWTQTVDDNTVMITYVVNTSEKQALANTSVTITNHSSEIEVISNKTQEVERIRGDEQKRVSYDIHVPKNTEQGNYTVTANLSQNGQTLDSANYTVWVNYGDQQTDSPESGSSDSNRNAAEENESESRGGGAPIMVAQECGWLCTINNMVEGMKLKVLSYLPESLQEWFFD